MEYSLSYKPEFINNATELLEKKSGILGSLLGKRFIASYVVWDLKEQEWFWDGAVVLDFEEIQLELCCNQMEDLSITTNTIDLVKPPRISWDPEGDYEWRKNSIEELNLVVGEDLKNVYIAETEFCSWPEEEKFGSPNMKCSWLLNGLDFCFNNGYFKFFNALDENGITNKLESDVAFRRINLSGKVEI